MTHAANPAAACPRASRGESERSAQPLAPDMEGNPWLGRRQLAPSLGPLLDAHLVERIVALVDMRGGVDGFLVPEAELRRVVSSHAADSPAAFARARGCSASDCHCMATENHKAGASHGTDHPAPPPRVWRCRPSLPSTDPTPPSGPSADPSAESQSQRHRVSNDCGARANPRAWPDPRAAAQPNSVRPAPLARAAAPAVACVCPTGRCAPVSATLYATAVRHADARGSCYRMLAPVRERPFSLRNSLVRGRRVFGAPHASQPSRIPRSGDRRWRRHEGRAAAPETRRAGAVGAAAFPEPPPAAAESQNGKQPGERSWQSPPLSRRSAAGGSAGPATDGAAGPTSSHPRPVPLTFLPGALWDH